MCKALLRFLCQFSENLGRGRCPLASGAIFAKSGILEWVVGEIKRRWIL